MKMMSRTSITSTMGVTLISAITDFRPLRWPLPPEEPPALMPMIWCSPPLPPYDTAPSPALVDLAREDRRKFVREPLQPLGLPVHLRAELIIENCRRNCGDQAYVRGKQGLRDARGHHRQRGVFRRRDGLEARHDAPYRAEQADKGPGGANGREHEEPPLQPLDLPRDRDVHHLLDA